VRVWPDPKYFDTAAIPMAELVHALRSKAVLLNGIKVTLHVEKTGETREWHYQEGLRGYLDDALAMPRRSFPSSKASSMRIRTMNPLHWARAPSGSWPGRPMAP
jgi:DNA gyrase/topoisomerase IV subunit B